MFVKYRFPNWKMPEIRHGVPTIYGWMVLNPAGLRLAKFTDIGWGTFINARYGVTIEEEVEIGPFCAILSDNSINGTCGLIVIGKGAKIGAYSLILPNVLIEAGTFIKARSIVK